MKTLQEAIAKVAALEAELLDARGARVTADADAKHHRGKHLGARRKMRLQVAARAQRRIAELQATAGTLAQPNSWIDGAVRALEDLHADVESLSVDDSEV